HMIAFALINAIAGQQRGRDYLALAGPGFRDFTRIAAADPQMWRDILVSNREELLAQSRLFQQSLQAMDALVDAGNAQALEALIAQASETRAHWRMSSVKPPR
ncbi:MAG: prephenate dehydrogenase/arogenate dehydrogenase family protein, partial [Burkholderiaceae bacterium]|nr:prephenate dehydrogenase/arogenate dehydrogenase family protein [Burkholderiaceae bacterium]